MSNLDLGNVSVVRHAKTVKRVPKSGSGGASGKHSPEESGEAIGSGETGRSGGSGTEIIRSVQSKRIYS